MKKNWKYLILRGVEILAITMMFTNVKVTLADTVIDAQPEQSPTIEQENCMISGWDEKKISYYENGQAVTGFKKIDGKLYYFDEKGKLYKKTGLQKISDNTYFFKKNHTIQTGIVKIKGKYFYFRKSNGVRAEKSGVKKIDGKYYRFNDNFELKSGWYRSEKGKRYYFDKKEFSALVGWNYVGKYKYFFEKNGQLCQDLRKKLAKKIKNQKNDQAAYYIQVNRVASCVTVYAKDGDNGYTIPVVAFVCSAGEATPIGTFKIRDKLRWHELMGPSWGQWCEHLTDDILFHSVYYDALDNKTLNVSAYNKLGTVASHGCVRLTAGDAKWIYDNCAVGTKVTIYNNRKKISPFDKPKARKLSAGHTWDPTDPAFK